MREPLGGQLAHPGVDHGIAGLAFLPGREGLGVIVPALAPATVVAPGRRRPVSQQLMEEVPPGELADERPARPARRL
jgi:hypothetical protein